MNHCYGLISKLFIAASLATGCASISVIEEINLLDPNKHRTYAWLETPAPFANMGGVNEKINRYIRRELDLALDKKGYRLADTAPQLSFSVVTIERINDEHLQKPDDELHRRIRLSVAQDTEPAVEPKGVLTETLIHINAVDTTTQKTVWQIDLGKLREFEYPNDARIQKIVARAIERVSVHIPAH